MSSKIRTSTKISVIGYLGGAGALANFVHQHIPMFMGETYTFDHGANLANGAIVLVSAVAILTGKAIEELEHKLDGKNAESQTFVN
jgi:hypothetical protein